MLQRIAAGEMPSKHHIAQRDATGRLCYEHCITREGFEGPYSILYHLRRPHLFAPSETTAAGGWPRAVAADPPLRRRHYRAFESAFVDASPAEQRIPLLYNDDVTISTLAPTRSDAAYFVNADADDLFFVLDGGGILRSQLGDLRFSALDYVCVPKGLLHRFILDEGIPQRWLTLECSHRIDVPRQWRNAVGQLRMDAPYCHRDFRHPKFVGECDEGIRDVWIKHAHRVYGFRVEHSPLDVIGWDGTLYPWAFPILSFQPRVGLVHLPPTWHGTFATSGALICSFVPRPVDFHPDAVPCPYPHSSVDVDEVIFYCDGEFTSRKGVGKGSLSHHPAGIPHGPHEGAYERSIGTARTSELAVMLDCAKPLRRTSFAEAIEAPDYHSSF